MEGATKSVVVVLVVEVSVGAGSGAGSGAGVGAGSACCELEVWTSDVLGTSDVPPLELAVGAGSVVPAAGSGAGSGAGSSAGEGGVDDVSVVTRRTAYEVTIRDIGLRRPEGNLCAGVCVDRRQGPCACGYRGASAVLPLLLPRSR